MKNKVYEVLFKDAKTLEVVKVKSDNMLDLCSSLKANGFKKRMEFKSNLSIIEACEMLHTLFPPKKKKNPVEGTLVGIDELIKPFSENKLFAKPPKLEKELTQSQIVSKIQEMADSAPCYTIRRQPTFFCKETKVSYNELKKFFTDKAINAMIEYGFIERNHSKYPIDFIENYPITFEEFALDSFKEDRKNIIKMMYGSEPTKLSGGKPTFVFGFSDELDAENLKKLEVAEPKVFQAINPNSYIDDDLKLEFDSICDKLDFIIDQISENFCSDSYDIYISKTDAKKLNEAFGGKVKKYKGHKIIVA